MAINNLISGVKQRVKAIYNNFFYEGGEAPAPHMQQEYSDPYAQGRSNPSQGYQPNEGVPHPGYGNPSYSQGQPQQPQGHRVRRAQRNQQEKVVDFSSYQQQVQQQYAAQQFAPQQPFAAQPGAYQQPPQQPQNPPQTAAQQPAEGRPAGSQMVCARIINARGMGDCRSAITLLRKGDSVLMVLENVTDPAEMRRLVDTLSGACYSLTATITKVSRYGVYLLAPQPVAVFADQATNMMNSVSGRQPRSYQGALNHQQRMNYPPQPGFQQAAYQQQAGYQPQMGYPPQTAYQQQAGYPPQQTGYAPQGGQAPYPPQQPVYQEMQPSPEFTQRSAMPEEAPRDFYQRSAPQNAQAPAFSAQQAGYGYAPDETRAVDQ